jgi:hypothetical protein
MHYSFWRWTSILMELEFASPVDNAGTRKLRAFRFYSKLFMVAAAALYVNAALVHSPALLTTPLGSAGEGGGGGGGGGAFGGVLAPSPAPTAHPRGWVEVFSGKVVLG